MGWLTNKVQKWSLSVCKREMSEFVDRLRVLDGEELGLIVAGAADQRHRMEQVFPINLLEPHATIISVPESPVEIRKLIVALQHEGKNAAAAWMMVWLHTLRSMLDLDLRGGGREMWRQLSRGFPHCETQAWEFEYATGISLNTGGYDIFPSGLTPDPR